MGFAVLETVPSDSDTPPNGKLKTLKQVLLLEELLEVGRERGAEVEGFGGDFDFGTVERLPGKEEELLEFFGEAVVDVIEVALLGGAVDFVADNGVADVLGVGADLVFATGFDFDAG